VSAQRINDFARPVEVIKFSTIRLIDRVFFKIFKEDGAALGEQSDTIRDWCV